MTTNWIIMDTSYIVYRSQYAMKEEASPLFSFFATVLSLRERFDSEQFIFCFDRGKLMRNDLLPSYKERVVDPIYEEEHKKAKHLMNKLRKDILPSLGFENLLSQPGYEADDIIASVVHNSLMDDPAVIVATDKDLLQLLVGDQVVMYNPNKEEITNESKFKKQWPGLEPKDWAMVKAIAGCRSDNVPGIAGVGEPTAAKFLQGLLPRHYATYDKIAKCPVADIEFRKRLTKLPFEGTKVFDLIEGESINWRKVQTYQPKEGE